jgi:hypothetical protein
MNQRILVRFNTKFETDILKRKWRLLIDGVEWLAHKIDIQVPCETITEPISTGEIKHHLLCSGEVKWDSNFGATIVERLAPEGKVVIKDKSGKVIGLQG